MFYPHSLLFKLVSPAYLFVIFAIVTKTSVSMSQETFNLNDELDQWQVVLSNDWDVLGPFPIHAREQHFLSPGFPLNLTSPYNHEQNRTWPSSLSETAEVTWRKVKSDADGNLVVSFPDVRWPKIRATEGWAGLQHHTILHTSLTVQRTSTGRTDVHPPRIRVQLTQGSFFTILSRDSSGSHTPEWHTGNIYAMNRAPPNSVELPGPLNDGRPTVFDFFVSGDYEIRLFGDPRDNRGQETPTLRINVVVTPEEKLKTVVRQDSHDVICDFVDGFAFGGALGVGLRSVDGWWSVESLELPKQFPKNISLSLHHKQLIAPSQTRIVPISIQQIGEYTGNGISFNVLLKERLENSNGSNPNNVSIPVTLTPRHLPLWNSSRWDAIRATFFFASSHPTYFLAKPPVAPSPDGRSVPMLALHGAGVDVIATSFWSDAVPRQEYSWISLPVGRTEWGLDWHGPSASEAWATLPALNNILKHNEKWKAWNFSPNSRALILGHSNGGQGAWYLASRYPDRTHALLAAAGFLSAAAYVPLTQSRGARFVDPDLRSVLESSFMPDDNALFLGNLADTVPVLAVHGGEDTNVPTWHSREYVSIIKSLGKGLNVSLHIDRLQPHWYPTVFTSNQVQTFLEDALDSEGQQRGLSSEVAEFPLTVADPVRSGSLNGFSIDELLIPGRLGRLHVRIGDDGTHVKTVNVRRFSVEPGLRRTPEPIKINGHRLPLDHEDTRERSFTISESTNVFEKKEETVPKSMPLGRVQNIFDTSEPITIIIPPDPSVYQSMLSTALRISHALDVYLKLDSEIRLDIDVIQSLDVNSGELENSHQRFPGNLVILGGKENVLSRKLLQVPRSERRTEFGLSESGQWLFRDKPLQHKVKEEFGLLFTHPHPVNPSGSAVFLSGSSTEDSGPGLGSLERVLRLFVPRTGIAVPDWMIVGREIDKFGAGGVIGAGVWDAAWKWNEAMSYMP